MSEIAKPNFHAGRAILTAQADRIDELRATLAAKEAECEALRVERDEARSGNRYAQLERLALNRAEAAEDKLKRIRDQEGGGHG